MKTSAINVFVFADGTTAVYDTPTDQALLDLIDKFKAKGTVTLRDNTNSYVDLSGRIDSIKSSSYRRY